MGQKAVSLELTQLTLAEKSALSAGVDLWHTAPIPRAGVPSIRRAWFRARPRARSCGPDAARATSVGTAPSERRASTTR